jgi:helix-turn-helix protein
VEWTYVPAGDDTHTDTQFSLVANGTDGVGEGTGNFSVKLRNTTASADAGETLTVKAGEDIVIDWAEDTNTATINHKAYGSLTSTPGSVSADGKSFTAITAITADNGHVTAWETKTFTLPEDQNTTYELVGKNNKIILTETGSNSESDAITVAGDNKWIDATVANEKLSVAHKTITVDNASEN